MFDQRSVLSCCLSALAICASVHADAVQWRVEDGGNGHWYGIATWGEACFLQNIARAEAAGGYLMTANSESEWIFASNYARSVGSPGFTIGARGPALSAGHWTWVTGEPWTYSAWGGQGQCAFGPYPNNGSAGYFLWTNACGQLPNGVLPWDDGVESNQCQGSGLTCMIEWSADCNNDGIVDYGQILDGTLVDTNGNGIPNVCDCASDSDGDGSVDCADGCPSDPLLQAPMFFYADSDGDGFGNPAQGYEACSAAPPVGYVENNTDCNDEDSGLNPDTVWFRDIDGDGVGSPVGGTKTQCEQPEGYVRSGNDNCPLNPDLTEPVTFCYDGDHDNYGDPSQSFSACSTIPPIGYSTNCGDCNDGNASINPGASETCNGADDDCDTLVDDGLVFQNYYADADADGYGDMNATAESSCAPVAGKVTNNTDCNDNNAAISPGEPEICDAANTDEDCDGFADNDDSSAADAGKSDFYVDADGDGYGAGSADRFCDQPSGYSTLGSDCNDNSNTEYPGAVEFCTTVGIDNDCDGVATDFDADAADKVDFYRDADLDTYTTTETAKFCPGTTNEGWRPSVSWPLDCNDNSNAIYPGEAELCATATVDNDCDGVTDDVGANAADKVDFYRDADLDTYTTAATAKFCPDTTAAGWRETPSVSLDCNDYSDAVFPGAPEFCANDGTDNDCNGEADDDSEALDSVLYYIDADSDGFGTGAGTGTMSCTPVPDRVPNNQDCDDNTLLYADGDGDGFGAGAPVACGVANNIDLCEFDSGKQNPGVCGCGNADLDIDADGRIDCRDVNLHLSVVSADLQPSGLVRLRVEAQAIQPVVEIIGAQFAISFDSAQMQVLDISPVPGAALSLEIFESIDQGGGKILYALGVTPPEAGFSGSTALFDITLQFHPWAYFCTSSELARFAIIGGFGSMLVDRDAVSLPPSESWDTYRQLDATPPVISALPDPLTVPFDAGNPNGAAIDWTPYWVNVSDPCGVNADTYITFPDGSAWQWYPWWGGWQWPSSFPAGTSTVRWIAWDNLGNYSEASTTITVEPYQLLDADVALLGAFDPTLPPFTRSIRLSVGAGVVVQPMDFHPSGPDGTQRSAHAAGVQVPVASGLPCIRAKDISFSLSDAGASAINGTRYAASFALRQGDSNDDDAVDIIDFGAWYVDVGPAAATDRSNFNADLFVNNADFAWIGLNFFQRGETCGGFVPGGEPLRRISVKELRRRGLGELAGADLNRDGWLDMRDVQAVLGGQSAALDAPEEGISDP